MIDLGSDTWDGRCGMFVPATPGTARRLAQVSQCIRLNLIGGYKNRCCPCSSIRMCPFRDEELNEFRVETLQAVSDNLILDGYDGFQLSFP